MNMIECKCENCGVLYLSPAKEVKRKQKKGTNFYCSLSCAGKKSVSHLNVNSENINRLRQWQESQKNLPSEVLQERQIKSRLKEFIRRSKNRKSMINRDVMDIDVDYLYELWKSCEGKCALTGVSIELTKHGGSSNYSPYAASLDRIDNTKGYIKGNVRFICTIANFARNCWDDQTVIEFAKKVVEYQKE